MATGAAAGLGAGAGAAAAAEPTLGPIRAVTTTAHDLAAVEHAYSKWLGYRVVERGVVPEATARSWGAPAVAGRAMLSMAPEAGEPTLLRFVEQAMPARFKPMTTLGWNSTEIIVRDCDAVARRLEGSPFRIVGPPKDLSSSGEIRALQAIGPANEMLYLTATTRPMPPERDMPTAEAFIGRTFITVLGGRSMAEMSEYYRTTFGRPTGQTFSTRIGSLATQMEVPPDTIFQIAVVQLGGGAKLELDAYPASAGPRPRPRGALPVGMAIVSFDCSDLDRHAANMAAPPAPAQIAPFAGRRSGVVTGSAGELIELIES